MKLIIQIPCFNEARTLPLVLRNMPKTIEGIDKIELLVIDDCSTDFTAEVAKSLGVHHIVRIRGKNRRWLGRAFRLGIDHALAHGADIVVNTDGDNQYPSEMIPELVRPIVEGRVDMAIGDRDPSKLSEFSPLKRGLQWLGSRTTQFVTSEIVKDAVSGFRAYSREALIKLHPITNYTYTVDTLIQAQKKGIDIAWIPISTNKKTRESRLIKSLFSKVRKSGITILRLSTVYAPFRTFLALSALFFIPGAVLIGRYAYFFMFVPGGSSGHMQSIIAGGVCLVIGVQIFILGIIGDLLAVNRSMAEDALTRLKRLELDRASPNVTEGSKARGVVPLRSMNE